MEVGEDTLSIAARSPFPLLGHVVMTHKTWLVGELPEEKGSKLINTYRYERSELEIHSHQERMNLSGDVTS